MKPTLPLVLALAATPALADETRQLDAHEHGVGELNIAVEGTTVVMEFHAPGADIVGFEHPAESDADHAAIEAGIATLSAPLDLFVMPAAAGCSVVSASAELESEEDHDDHGADDHDDHGKDEDHDDHADGHDHADHGEDKEHDDHAHGSEHDHADEASHTEFHAEYALNCASPADIDSIDFAYFEAFENALEVEVQIVTEAGAQAFEVARDAPKLSLGGIF